DDDTIRHLARTLKNVLLRVKRCLDDPAFNFIIHTIPNVKATPKRTAYWDTIEFDFHCTSKSCPGPSASPVSGGGPASTSTPVRPRKLRATWGPCAWNRGCPPCEW